MCSNIALGPLVVGGVVVVVEQLVRSNTALVAAAIAEKRTAIVRVSKKRVQSRFSELAMNK
jgi:hypothetical protein